MLIGGLADVFYDEVGGYPATTPDGPFCRLLAIVWEILPTDQRCGNKADTFVFYARDALREWRKRRAL
jgi:hypothetical protein